MHLHKLSVENWQRQAEQIKLFEKSIGGALGGADGMIKHYYSDNRNMLFLYCLYYSDKKV